MLRAGPLTRAFVACLVTILSVPAVAGAANDPVAAYGFEDPGGGTVAGDSSIFGNTGTVVGGATRAAGRFGSAIIFDGANDRVNIPDAGSLNLASGMTLEAWVNPTATAGWRTVLLKERKIDLSYALYGSGQNNPSGYVATTAQTGSARASSPLTVGTWTHIATTYDGTTLRTFVNGAQVATSMARSGPMTPGQGPLSIGGNTIYGEYFAGLIDEVRVYDRPLSAAEIQTDMNAAVGAPAASAPGLPADEAGRWTAPQNWPMVAVHASMLSNGKVVAWDAFSAAPQSEHVWDPETGTFVQTPSGINLFCAGHVLLPDGRLFTAGGHDFAAYVGLRDTRLFNPLTSSWTAGPTMASGRWYPTTTTLADGRVLIVSGDNIRNGPNDPFFVRPSDTIPEVYDPKTNTISQMPSAGRVMPLYPMMFLAPDGRVVDAGPDQTTRLLNTQTGQWSTLASQSPMTGHSAVMYRPGKILKTGTWSDTDYGSPVVESKAAVLDLDQGVPAWRNVAPMKWARTQHNLTVLPDGTVMALAGQSRYGANNLYDSPVLQPEIWDPVTDKWTSMTSPVRPRGYHNTSLLLPDGRILLAGSGRLDGSLMIDETTAEIFSPPYLHKGPRPTIANAPGAMSYGGKIDITTPDAARISKVSLVRIGAVTHSFNMDQRWQELNFRQVGGKLEIDAPTSANSAPPGVYYVFLLDANGVPSRAAILSIAPGSGTTPNPDTEPPSTVSGVTATGALGRVTLGWSAATDNIGVTRYAVHRSTASGFTPSASTQIATVSSGTSYADTGLTPGTYYYRVVAEDAAGNAGVPSSQASGTALADTTAPAVSLTAPAAGATVRGSATLTASASDDVGVVGVQFRLDGANLGAEDTTAPYSVVWDSTTATAGPHTLTAVARDAAGNSGPSSSVPVTVDNSTPAGPVPVAAYSFEEGSGSTVADATGKGHTGTIREATWTTTGRNSKALAFDGVNDWVTIDDAADLRLTTSMTLEAWVNPTRNDAWRTAIMKERTGDLAWAMYGSGAATPSVYAYTTAGNGSARGATAAALNTWTHLAATYDGAVVRLYVNGVQAATGNKIGTLQAGAGAVRLGGNGIWGEWFAGQLDDVRIYDKALTAAQIQSDMNSPVGPPAPSDTTAPSVVSGVTAASALSRVTLSWNASTDNVGVVRYVVHRSTTSGFTPGAATRIAMVSSGTSYADTGLTPGTYYYRVVAEDAAGNASAPSAEIAGEALTDTTAPSVVTGVTAASALSRVTLGWSAASDNVGVVRYVVHRSSTSGFTPSASNRIATVASGTSYADAPLAPGIYYYVVIAEDAAGNASAPSAEIAGEALADTTPPSAVSGVTATNALGRVTLGWSAATDNVGVVRYFVHRSATSGFTPGAGNRIATVSSGTSYADNVAAGTYYYRVIAEDAAGNSGAPSAELAGTSLADTPPAVSITAPAAGATIRGSVTLTASASDDVGVAGVQFRLDGTDLGGEDTSAPYSFVWDSTAASAGGHTLTAIARDTAGNPTTSATVAVTVDNSAPAGPVPVAAYAFDEGAGGTVADATGKGHTGTIREATWSAVGKNGKALAFDGVNDWVTIDDAADLRLTTGMTLEAWIRPTATAGWRTAIMKERTGDLAWALYASGQNSPSVYAFTTAGNGLARTTTVLGVNAWTHVAASYDGAVVRLYVNGVQVVTGNKAGTLQASAGAVRLGGNGVWGEWFAGQLDDVRIYNRALSAAQIQTDMNTPVQ